MLVQQQISQPSTLKSGLTLTITRGGLQRVRMSFRLNYLDSALVTGSAEG